MSDPNGTAELKCRNGDVWAAAVAMPGQLSTFQRLGQWALPVKAAHAFVRLRREAATVTADIEATRMQLIAQYAEHDEEGQPKVNGQTYCWRDEAAFARDWQALLAEETTLAGCRKVRLEELGDAIRPTPDDLLVLAPFLEDEPPTGA